MCYQSAHLVLTHQNEALNSMGFQWLGLISLNRNPDSVDPPAVSGSRSSVVRPKAGWRQRVWRFSLRQGDHDLHVVDGEEASPTVYHALIPVLIYLICKDDDVPLLKSKLVFALWLKVIKGAAARLVQHLRLWTENILKSIVVLTQHIHIAVLFSYSVSLLTGYWAVICLLFRFTKNLICVFFLALQKWH